MKYLLTLLLFFGYCNYIFSQCSFFDDYSTNSGWTQVGNDVEVVNGQLEYINGAIDGEGPGGDGQKRVYKSLGAILDCNDTWSVEFTFTPSSVGINLGLPWTGHNLFALTAGNQEPLNNCPDLPCTGFPTGIQDGICVYFGAPNPPSGNVWFKIIAREGSSEFQTTNFILANTMNITYYPRLERTSSTNLTLSVFSDAARTTHFPGSPISLTIPNTVSSNISDLSTIQHGNLVRGNYQRALTAVIDDLCINYTIDTTSTVCASSPPPPTPTPPIVDEPSVSDSVCKVELLMPNVFSPNQDGFNDLFLPIKAECISFIHTRIFSRWGQELFSSNQLNRGWDGRTATGKKVPDGTYFYIVNYTDEEGTSNIVKGTVTLIR